MEFVGTGQDRDDALMFAAMSLIRLEEWRAERDGYLIIKDEREPRCGYGSSGKS